MVIQLKPQFRAKTAKIITPDNFSPFKITYHSKNKPAKQAQRLGNKMTHDILHNCFTCARSSSCKDTNKNFNYRCTRYREATLEATTIEELFRNPEPDDPNVLSEEEAFQNDGSEDSIVDMISRVIDNNVPVPPDLRINDAEIPDPKNFMHWITNDKFGKAGMPPFPRQVELGLKLFAEFCPRCSDEEWFDEMKVDAPLSEIRDRVQPLVFGVCPKCHITKSELVINGELNDYYGLVVLAGQRAAKTSSMILWDTYNLARTLKLPAPQVVFNVQSTTVFTSTYTALTFQQAVENMWNPYLNTLKGIPWFTNYHKFLTRRGEELGEELFNIGEHMVRYRHRNLLLAPSGPSKRTMRGRCVTGDTLINTADGFVEMEEFITKNGYHAHEVVVDSHNGTRLTSHTYKGRSKTLQVKTRNGFEIEGTPEHPMLVITPDFRLVWRRLDNMRLGDFIVSYTNKNKPLFGNNPVSLNMATMLGYLTANGYYNSLSSDDIAVTDRFKQVASELGLKVHSSKKTSERAQNHTIEGGNKEKNKFYRSLGDYGYFATNSYEKEIPYAIRMAPENVLHEYLEAYFECDSGVNGDYISKGSSAYIELSSASEKLVKQLQIILLHAYKIVGRRSIVTKTETSYGPETTRDYHILRLTGYDAVKFLDCFKRAKVQKYKERFWSISDGFGGDRRVVPYVRETLWNLYNTHQTVSKNGNRSKHLTLVDGSKVRNNLRPKFFATMKKSKKSIGHGTSEGLFFDDKWTELLPRIAQMDDTIAKRLARLIKLRPHFEEVISVTAGQSKKHVYDLTVPNGHAFTANGLASHNTRWTAAMDEPGWYPIAKRSTRKGDSPEMERLDAKGVFDALNNSLLTLKAAHSARVEEGYNDLPKPIIYAISSPSQYNDFIMSSYRLYQGSTEVLSKRYCTWEFNPLLKKKNFKEIFRTKPVEAARDYECNPPLGESLFISEHSAIIKAFRSGHNRITVFSKKGLSKTKTPITLSSMQITTNAFPLRGTVLSVDVGVVNNSFSFSIVGVPDDFDNEILPEDRGTMQTPVKVWAIGEIIPRSGTKISLTSVYTECFVPLIDAFNVKYMVSDRWNNIKIAQDLEATYEVIPLEHKASWPDFEATRELLYSGNLILPKLSAPFDDIIKTTLDNYPECFRDRPLDHLAWQFATVRESTGVTVLKGDGGTDDTFRTIVLGVAQVQDNDVLETLMSVNNAQAVITPAHSFVVKYGSGGNKGNSQQGIQGFGGAPLGLVKRLGR